MAWRRRIFRSLYPINLVLKTGSSACNLILSVVSVVSLPLDGADRITGVDVPRKGVVTLHARNRALLVACVVHHTRNPWIRSQN